MHGHQVQASKATGLCYASRPFNICCNWYTWTITKDQDRKLVRGNNKGRTQLVQEGYTDRENRLNASRAHSLPLMCDDLPYLRIRSVGRRSTVYE